VKLEAESPARSLAMVFECSESGFFECLKKFDEAVFWE